MRVLITGGAGFVGSHIADACIREGYETFILDNLVTGRLENIHQAAEWIDADIARDALDPLFAQIKPDVVYHLAANASVALSMQDPLYDEHTNIRGTIQLLQAAAKHAVKKVIYASSAAIYGDPSYYPLDERHPIAPLSAYGISKYVPELYLRVYHQHYGVPFTALRYANIYGPRQIAEGEGGVIAIFTDRVVKNETLYIQGDGDQTRDFIYIDDIVAANIAAIEHGTGKSYNIGTGRATSINDLVYTMRQVTGKDITVAHTSPREGDIRHSYFNSSAAHEELHWQPTVALDEGLRRTLQYYQNRQKQQS